MITIGCALGLESDASWNTGAVRRLPFGV